MPDLMDAFGASDGATHHPSPEISSPDDDDSSLAIKLEPDAPDEDPRRPSDPRSGGPPSDYPEPAALRKPREFYWDEDAQPADNYSRLGLRLGSTGDLYRNTGYGDGLLLASSDGRVPTIPIRDAAALASIIVDRVPVRVFKGGKDRGTTISSGHLRTMLRSESFLRSFRPVDAVVRRPCYLHDFRRTSPGYNDGGYGQRVLQVGGGPGIEPAPVAIKKFLDVMEFATTADRTNAVAAALTVLLRNHWPSSKPCMLVTSTKSHGGKETIVRFAAGPTRTVSIGYQAEDWAIERAFVGAIKHDPEVGVIDVENARLERGQSYIRSAFLERLVTDPEPLLYSTGSGGPVRRRNDLVVAITTNFGQVSEDLMNRALPIHLAPVGDVAGRASPIGNPKLEFLPANCDRIEAELAGMIERWTAAGRPLDGSVRHPCGPWAATVGGILEANGFDDFLANYGERRASDDPIRRGLGLLGAERPGEWLRPSGWSLAAAGAGLVAALIPKAERDSAPGRERAMGVVLTNHQAETFMVEHEGRLLELRLERARRRFEEGGEAQVRYRYEVKSDREIPGDHEDVPAHLTE